MSVISLHVLIECVWHAQVSHGFSGPGAIFSGGICYMYYTFFCVVFCFYKMFYYLNSMPDIFV